MTVHRTYLVARMRDWMKTQSWPFSLSQLCTALNLSAHDRDQAAKAIRDFLRRDEIRTAPAKRNQRQTRYRYNRQWHRKHRAGVSDIKIYKAMYISHRFAVTDIQRLAGLPSRSWIDQLARRLRKAGHLTVVSKRICAHGSGVELIYHIPNRDKFRIEVMK